MNCIVHAHVSCFVRDHQQRMAVFNGFGDPFSSFGFPSTRPAIDNGERGDRSLRNNRQLAPHDMFGSMFGNMFANMNSMMANMHQNFVSGAYTVKQMVILCSGSGLYIRKLAFIIDRCLKMALSDC